MAHTALTIPAPPPVSPTFAECLPLALALSVQARASAHFGRDTAPERRSFALNFKLEISIVEDRACQLVLADDIKEGDDETVDGHVSGGGFTSEISEPIVPDTDLQRIRDQIGLDVVYFLCADRIAREPIHQRIIVSELLKHKKRIIISGKDYEENPENKFARLRSSTTTICRTRTRMNCSTL